MARGFVIQNNFFESDTGASDRGILDNLGGVGITDDILLFDGNLRAVSTIKAKDRPVVEATNFVFSAINRTITSTSVNFRQFNDGDEITISLTENGENDTPENTRYIISGNPTQTQITLASLDTNGDPVFLVEQSGGAKIEGPETDNYTVVNGEIVISGEGIVPFSEGTLVSYGENSTNYKYRVVNSDTVSRFSLVGTDEDKQVSVDFTASSTQVNETTDVITSIQHGFFEGEVVVYDAGTGTAPTGLIDGNKYSVVNVTTDTFQIAQEGTTNVIDFAKTATGTSHTFTSQSQVPFVPAAPYQNINRSDSIIQSDLFNLNTPRPDTGSGRIEGGDGGGEEVPALGNGGSVDSGDGANTTSLFDEFTLGQQIAYIAERVSLFTFKRGRVPITTKPTTLDANVTFEGNLIISNTNGESIDGNPDAPGLYIAGNGELKRAFSDLSNPWDPSNITITPDSNGVISSTSDAGGNPITDAQANKLTFAPESGSKPTFEFNSGDGVASAPGGGILINNYTHKLECTINGETYFLLIAEG